MRTAGLPCATFASISEEVALARLVAHNLIMGKLVEHTLESLDKAKTVNDLQSCLWVAGDLLRKFSSSNFRSQFEEIDREAVSELEARQIEQALLNALPRNPDPRWVGQILSGLSCSRDVSLTQLWVNQLAKYLEILKAANGILYTTLAALNELDEPVFEENQRSRNIMDIEKTVDNASRYLHRRGISVPW